MPETATRSAALIEQDITLLRATLTRRTVATGAAALLGIHRATLRKKLKEYGLA